MKKFIFTLLFSFLGCVCTFAQSAGDKIIGNYIASSEDGKQSKIKIFKYKDGYRAQVYWIKEPKNADGTLKLDTKNPDKAKAKLPISQAVIIDKVTYKDGEWANGKVYDPQTGKRWTVNIKFKDDKTLAVHGSLIFGIGKTVYWPKID